MRVHSQNDVAPGGSNCCIQACRNESRWIRDDRDSRISLSKLGQDLTRAVIARTIGDDDLPVEMAAYKEVTNAQHPG